MRLLGVQVWKRRRADRAGFRGSSLSRPRYGGGERRCTVQDLLAAPRCRWTRSGRGRAGCAATRCPGALEQRGKPRHGIGQVRVFVDHDDEASRIPGQGLLAGQLGQGQRGRPNPQKVRSGWPSGPPLAGQTHRAMPGSAEAPRRNGDAAFTPAPLVNQAALAHPPPGHRERQIRRQNTHSGCRGSSTSRWRLWNIALPLRDRILLR